MWLPLFTIIFFRLIHIVTGLPIVCAILLLSSISLYEYTTVCRWTYGLFPILAVTNQVTINILIQEFGVMYIHFYEWD